MYKNAVDSYNFFALTSCPLPQAGKDVKLS